MPKPIKKKIRKRKAPVREEEINGTYSRVWDFVNRGKRQFMTGLLSIIAITVIILTAMYYNSSLKEKAYALEVEAYNYYYGINPAEDLTDKERWEKALELYKKSVETRATPSALFYLGNCYYNLGKYRKAIVEYERFIQKFKGKRELLPIVYQKLASAYINQGDEEKALSTLKRLAALDGSIFKDTALILEARYYELKGEKKKAVERYKELIEGFPSSPWVNEAGTKITAGAGRAEEGTKEKQDKDEKTEGSE